MRAQLDKTSEDKFDLKQGRGGIADLEFLVQYLALKNAAGNKAVIHYRDNIRQLGTLGAANCLPSADVAELQQIYREYRARLHQLALDRSPPLVNSDDFVSQRESVIALWQREMGGDQHDEAQESPQADNI